MSESIDVLILGGGMIGLSLANALAPRGDIRVAVVDPKLPTGEIPPPGALESPSFDGRASAVSFGSATLLDKLGIWPFMAPHACAIEHIQVSDLGQFGQTHLHAAEQNTEALGYIVENKHIGQALLHALPEHVVRISDASAERIDMHQSHATVFLDNHQSIDAKLVVLADGGRSELAQNLGVHYRTQPYHTHALVTSIDVDRSHGHWAYERFTPAGPIAFLPLNEHQFAIAWTLADDEIDEAMNASDAELIARLQSQIGDRIGLIQRIGTRSKYPLAMKVASEQVRHRLVLLGNSAHSLHPVAGQGFNLAFRDALSLAEHLGNVPRDDIGTLDSLMAYEQAQAQDQYNTVTASDLLPKIFSLPHKTAKVVRNSALLALAATPTTRRLFTRHAMGLGHTRPRLLNEERHYV